MVRIAGYKHSAIGVFTKKTVPLIIVFSGKITIYTQPYNLTR